jgi:hypothetical protein
MMVGNYRQHLACVAAQLNGVKRHHSMKASGPDPQLGLVSPLNYAANKSGKNQNPLRRRRSGSGWMQAATPSARAGERIFS